MSSEPSESRGSLQFLPRSSILWSDQSIASERQPLKGEYATVHSQLNERIHHAYVVAANHKNLLTRIVLFLDQ